MVLYGREGEHPLRAPATQTVKLPDLAAAAVRVACVVVFISRQALAHATRRVVVKAITKGGG